MVFEGKTLSSGTKEIFNVPILDGEQETYIPGTIFQGLEHGPVLGITIVVHAYEYLKPYSADYSSPAFPN